MDLLKYAPITTWREAEFFAAAHMRSLGFGDAAVTRSGADGGIDVTATFACAQVKFWKTSQVSSPVIDRLVGVSGDLPYRLIYSLTPYTPVAWTVASERGVALFRYGSEGVVTPESTAAEELIQDRFVLSSASYPTEARKVIPAAVVEYGLSVATMGAVLLDEVNMLLDGIGVLDGPGDVSRESLRSLVNQMLQLRRIMRHIPRGMSDPSVGFSETLNEINKLEGLLVSMAGQLGLDYAEAETEVARRQAACDRRKSQANEAEILYRVDDGSYRSGLKDLFALSDALGLTVSYGNRGVSIWIPTPARREQ